MRKILFIITAISVTSFSIVKAQQMQTRTDFNKMLSAYFDIKNALATDQVNLANAGAKNLLTNLKSFPIKQLNETQQGDWKIQAEELKKFTEPMVTEKDLKIQRTYFTGIAYAMIKLVKAVNLNNNDVFVQYCPMIKKSWLNETEDVQNPYYGSKMYNCGEVTSTVAKK